MSQLPAFSRDLPRPAVGQNLRALYMAWLSTPAPYSKRAGNVAGSKTRAGMLHGHQLAQASQAAWDQAEGAFSQGTGKVWVWSDLHLFHTNIIRYSGRPFHNTHHMLDSMLANAQAVVAPEDWLLCLGDLSFGEVDQTRAFLDALDCRKALILGNHDVDRKPKLDGLASLGFEAIADVQDWQAPAGLVDQDGVAIERVWLTHYPLWSPWLSPGIRNVHGHVHQNNVGGRCVNASVEHTGYAPVLLETLLNGHRVQPLALVADDVPRD